MHFHYDITILSANVTSLFTGPEGHSGKLSYLRQQMRSHGALIMGIQESRSPAGQSSAENFLRLATGSDRGHHGLELWVDLQRPVATCGQEKWYIKPHHVAVLVAEPRLLIARLSHPHFDVHLVVAHGPQSGRPEAERAQWWERLQQRLLRLDHLAPVWLMIDANARSGPCDHRHVHDFDDTMNPNSQFLRDGLYACNMFLPATDTCHCGPHETWIHPNGLHASRIDFIVLPQAHRDRVRTSWVLEDFDLGNVHGDHRPVGCRLTWSQTSLRVSSTPPQPSIRRELIDRQRFEAPALGELAQPWDCDVWRQAEHTTGQIVSHLTAKCAADARGPKKSFISEATWDLRKEKLRLRALFAATGRAMKQEQLWTAWRILKHDVSFDKQAASRYYTRLECDRLRLGITLARIAKQVKLQLRSDKDRQLQATLADVHSDTPAGVILARLRPFIGPSNPKKIKKKALPMLQSAEGTILTEPQHLLDRWIEFFADMEGGIRMELADYHKQWIRDLARFEPAPHERIHPSDLPSLQDLELAFRRVRPGKAVGMDGLPPEVCREYAPELARAYFPLMMKLIAFGQEPSQWKGGRLTTAYKQKGDVTLPSSHRSLLISSHAGKAVHRAVRQNQSALMQRFFETTQLGGRPHMPVGVGMHTVRAYCRTMKQRHRSSALIFVDLREAFYRIVRGLALDHDLTDEAIVKMIHTFNLPPSAIHDLHQHLGDPHALAAAGFSVAQIRSVSCIHSATWFRMSQQPDLVATTRGSRPGDSFADVIFGFVYARVLKAATSKLIQLDLLDVFDHAQFGLRPPDSVRPQPMAGPTWMDDTCLMVSGDTASATVSRVAAAAGIFIDECRGFALTPNLSAGKTEIVLSVRGPGTKRVKKQFFADPQSQFLTVCCEDGTERIRLVGEYLHLGGIVHHQGKSAREARRRLSIAHGTYTQHRRLLFGNHQLPWQRRKELFEALILSRLCYGMESWSLQDQRSANALHCGIMRLYRRFAGFKHDAHVSDADILFHTCLPEPSVLLRRSRLRYLGQLYSAGTCIPWGLFHEDLEWRQLIWADLQWLWDQLWRSSSLPDPMTNFDAWQEILCHSPRYWKRLVNRGTLHAIRQHARVHRVERFHVDMLHRVCESTTFAAPAMSRPLPLPDDPEAVPFACMACQRTFATKAGLGAHLFRSHGIVNSVRILYDQTSCGSCLKEFHTSARLQAHLRYSQQCRRSLQARAVRCSPAPGIGSTDNAQLEHHHDGLAPTLQGEGPLPPPAPVDFVDSDEHVELTAALADYLLDFTTVDALHDHFRAAVCSLPVSWQSVLTTCHSLVNHYTPEEAAVSGCSIEELQQVVARICDPTSWPFLLAQRQRTCPVDFYEAEAWFIDHAHASDWSSFAAVRPAPQFGKLRYILHAFSGRRRYGDVQHYLDFECQSLEGTVVAMLSVDLIISSSHGDLSHEGTQRFWISAIQNSWIIGLLCGPPCNSWSRARGTQLADQRGRLRDGPRIVRTSAEAWGLSAMTLKELATVDMGNCLLHFCLRAFLELVFTGGCAVLEHPAQLELDRASIWSLPVVAFIRRMPGVCFYEISQGEFGSESAKPTGLLALNQPGLERRLRAAKIAGRAPSSATIGITSQGTFATAPLKEYPPAMCYALSGSFSTAATNSAVCPGREPPESFCQLCSQLQLTTKGDVIGTDFAP
eukprot:Skav212431  [mRNA]  locus=scaffold1479:102244:107277:+ [translate_table: standard]